MEGLWKQNGRGREASARRGNISRESADILDSRIHLEYLNTYGKVLDHTQMDRGLDGILEDNVRQLWDMGKRPFATVESYQLLHRHLHPRHTYSKSDPPEDFCVFCSGFSGLQLSGICFLPPQDGLWWLEDHANSLAHSPALWFIFYTRAPTTCYVDRHENPLQVPFRGKQVTLNL